MKARWPQFGRKRAATTAPTPDNAVATPPAWLLGAAIIASTAALLGTSDVSEPSTFRTYTFARSGIDGGFVELTRDQPAATFFVTVHADDLGPEGVPTTDEALATIDGMITTMGLADGAVAPAVDVKLSTPDGPGGSEKIVVDSINQKQSLLFTGDCEHPRTSASCAAHFAVAVSRQDQGESDGVVRFDWLFDVESKGQAPSQESSEVGPLDPPWTTEVTQQ